MTTLAPAATLVSNDYRQRGRPTPKAVHFDQDCVLIPETPKITPRFSSKTYALPLWRSSPGKETTHIKFKMLSFGNGSKPRMPSPSREHPLPSPSCLRSHESFIGSNAAAESSPVRPSYLPLRRDVSDPGTSAAYQELSVSQTRSPTVNRTRSASAGTPESPIIVVPLRGCCAECFPKVEHAMCQEYEEKWTRGARRRRRSASALQDTPVGTGRVSVELLRVDELPTPQPSPQEECLRSVATPTSLTVVEPTTVEDDCYLFPLPCHKKRKARRDHLSGDSDNSGTSTPSSSAEDVPPPLALLKCSRSLSPVLTGTPALTPTSEAEDPFLASPKPEYRSTTTALPPLHIPSLQSIPTDPNDPDPDAIPASFIAAKQSPPASVRSRSASTSPVRTRLLSGAGSIFRGAMNAANTPSVGRAF
ncbi:hypothetical protein BKA62DRAFT_768002 [Auriculariales sp. MPI-PUGE-AT-0066]|nr:hypothetical protein BKA62DRAFT_768002 [Auriculariales sp. MPI-PUGE-AT-0066]